jgi:hypothetical protein
MQLKTGKSITSLGRQKSFSKSNDKSEGGSSSTEEHPRKLTVVVNEITNLHDIESEHYIEISLDCSDKIYSTKPLSGPVLKWNKKFSLYVEIMAISKI